ncbi:MAG: RHS repeat-associated core domain-containing protein [Saprospiraceae bacterium]|nr:RHS repeat-associated core domain-containing protein [Saprospiraceae bacterium]
MLVRDVSCRNHLNLPNSINNSADSHITLTYTSAKGGEKLTKISPTETRNYVAGIEYLGTNLEAIYHAEGRCTPNGATAFHYEYTLKDHLGNARVNFRANGTAVTFLEEMHYYPFGMLMEGMGTQNPANKYHYNGKELNDDLGLNWYDYGARWYDAAVGRWWSVDPLAEEYSPFTSYAYGMNNPMVFIDPDGRLTIFVGGAAFGGRIKPNKINDDFTQNLIAQFRGILGDDDFHVARGSKRFLGMVSNSVWSIRHGDKIIKNVARHKALNRTINEITDRYQDAGGIDYQGKQTEEPLNLIGSSYGSVIVAQSAIHLIKEKGLRITTLTLSASPIDPNSELGQELLELEKNGLIGNIIWHPNVGDNVTGSSGNRSVGKLILNWPSIAFPNHPHNKARKNTSRTDEIIINTLMRGSEGPGTQYRAGGGSDPNPKPKPIPDQA